MDNLFESIKKRNEFRKNTKKAYDSILSFSIGTKENEKNKFSALLSVNDNKATLLTEGSVLYSDGSMRCYLKKGTLDKFINGSNEELENIDRDYVGLINIGHTDYVRFPDRVVGSWDKDNLHLVDYENGRKAIEVDKLTIDFQHPLIQILKSSKSPIGLSAEFYFHIDEEESENATQVLRQAGIEDYVMVIDEICISDYAIVGECGDVNASDLLLDIGDDKVQNEEIKKPIEDEKIEETTEEKVEEVVEETPNETTKKAIEEVEEMEKDTCENKECDNEEEKQEENEETTNEVVEEEKPSMEEVLATIKSLQEEIKTLKDEKKEVEEQTKEMFKSIKLDVADEEEKKEEKKEEVGYKFDPIGHL